MSKIFAIPQRYKRFTDKCESPIERILVVELLHHIYLELYDSTPYSVELQKEIRLKTGKKVRVDVFIAKKSPQWTTSLAIECDGKDFHNAEKDRERDEEMAKLGIVTLRFAGTQIYNDAKSCVDEIMRIIEIIDTNNIQFLNEGG